MERLPSSLVMRSPFCLRRTATGTMRRHAQSRALFASRPRLPEPLLKRGRQRLCTRRKRRAPSLSTSWVSKFDLPPTRNLKVTMAYHWPVGDGISIFFTLVETGPRNLSTICNFVLDDGPAEQYRHTPVGGDSPSFTYQANTFSRAGLKHSQHKLVISIPPSAQEGSYLNFDYAQYR